MELRKIALSAAAVLTLGMGMMSTADHANAGSWVKCTHEGGFCKNIQKSDMVAYGAGEKWVQHPVNRNGFWCTNQNFGDPVRGKSKSCYVWKKSWVKCAHEGGHCKDVPNGALVKYGWKNKEVRKNINGGSTWCTNAVFGDPASGKRKHCYIWK